jgi:hypothetical protein
MILPGPSLEERRTRHCSSERSPSSALNCPPEPSCIDRRVSSAPDPRSSLEVPRMSKLHLVIFVLTVALTLFVWRAGRTPVLSFIDYRTIADRAGFNRFAATRLVPIPVVALLCLVLASARPELSLPLVFVELLAAVASANWVSMGVPGFRAERIPPAAA